MFILWDHLPSQNGKILAYSPVNIIGKILDSSNKHVILNQIKERAKVIIGDSILFV